MATKRCIYCLDEKPDGEFNTEHVLPKAFGRFEASPTLSCVCTGCNSHFGRELDLKLGRDTIEGFRRHFIGLKFRLEYQSLGRRSTSRTEIAEGPLRGAFAKILPSPDSGLFNMQPLPQVGFAKEPGGPFDWNLLGALPSNRELEAKGYVKGKPIYIQSWEADTEDVRRELELKGFKVDGAGSDAPPPSGATAAEFVFRITHPEFRAFAKIAFNYLAFVAGAGFVLLPNFNEVRRYIRYDVRPTQSVIHAIGRPMSAEVRPRFLGHYIVVVQTSGGVFACVCLGATLDYWIILSRVPLLVHAPFTKGHLFNVATKRASLFVDR